MLPTRNTIPYDQRPTVTYTLMLVCLGVFGYQLSLNDQAELRFLLEYALVPARFTDSAWAAKQGLASGNLSPFVTSMFLHGGFLHIAGNLWTLWVFGPALEDRLGPSRFAALYLVSGLGAGLTHFIFNFSSAVPALGASGAIAGVIAGYVRRFPYAWINVFQPIGLFPLFFYMPALVFAGIWFLMQVTQASSSMLLPGGAGGVAWWAHIGGFVVGWILVKRLAPAPDPQQEHKSIANTVFWPMRVWLRWWQWLLKRRW